MDDDGGLPGLIHYIPPHREKDCIFISPDHPIPIDVMSWQEGNFTELEDAVNDLVAIFHRLDPSWGIQIGALLDYSLYTLLLSRSKNFLDINKILTDESWRKELLKKIPQDNYLAENTRTFWERDYPKMEKGSQLRITVNRMSKFLLSPFIHATLKPSPHALNIQEAIESNKILLVSLGVVKNETDSVNLVGSMIVSKIQQALFRRKQIPKSQRKPFALYVDEFHNVKSAAFTELLSKARGFNLSACLANQHPGQVKDYWEDITGCVDSYVLFRMDPQHAQKFAGKIHEPQVQTNEYERFAEKRDRKKRVHELKEEMADVKRQIKQTEKDFEYTPWSEWGYAIKRGEVMLANYQKEIDDLEDEEFFKEKRKERTPFLDQIPRLEPGQAIYIDYHGVTRRITTDPQPDAPETSPAQRIIQATYATYGEKRTVDKPAGHDTENVVGLKDDVPTDADGNSTDPLLPKRPQKAGP